MATFSDMCGWDATSLRESRNSVLAIGQTIGANVGAKLKELADTETWWRGRAAEACANNLRASVVKAIAIVGACRGFVAELTSAANAVEVWVSYLREYDQEAEVRQLRVLDNGVVADQLKVKLTPMGIPVDGDRLRARHELTGKIQPVMAELEDCFRRAEQARLTFEASLGTKLPPGTDMAPMLAALPQDALRIAEASLPADVSGLPASPATVAQWWGANVPVVQQMLLAKDARALALERGLPWAVLDKAGRAALFSDYYRLKQRVAHPTEAESAALFSRSMLNNLSENNGYGESGAHFPELDHYDLACSQLAKVEGIMRALDSVEQTGRPTFLMGYSLTSNDGFGTANIGIGNPSTARNADYLVPGTGNNPRTMSLANAFNLYDEMTRLNGPGQFVELSQDYNIPQNIATDSPSDSYADEGVPNISRDLGALRLNGRITMHLTGVGHSYGTVALAKALEQGDSPVDDMIDVGSPGLAVNNVRYITGVPARHTWSGLSQSDPMGIIDKDVGFRFTQYPGIGAGPTDSGFGDNVFAVDNSGGHSDYFDAGSLSLQNMAQVSVAHYGSVTLVHAAPGGVPHRIAPIQWTLQAH